MSRHSSKFKPVSFRSPEQLPETLDRTRNWQNANRIFWESNPMRYDWNKAIEVAEFTQLFYEEVDRRFFASVFDFMPWKGIPFEALIDFENLRTKKVLEIGDGVGSHASLLAPRSSSYVGIDITAYATSATANRMMLQDTEAGISQMDAENLAFPDFTFDFVWSWGVVHHSANTRQVLREIHRVLKSGGKAVIMVYHRGWWNYYAVGFLIRGLILGGILKHGSLHRSVQSDTDGALARYYSPSSWANLVQDLFILDYVKIMGSKSEIILLPRGNMKNFVMKMAPNKITRFMTNKCQMGSFLISSLTKR